jgi:hypothetical protein
VREERWGRGGIQGMVKMYSSYCYQFIYKCLPPENEKKKIINSVEQSQMGTLTALLCVILLRQCYP